VEVREVVRAIVTSAIVVASGQVSVDCRTLTT
jgi:hypothetical protein